MVVQEYNRCITLDLLNLVMTCATIERDPAFTCTVEMKMRMCMAWLEQVVTVTEDREFGVARW